MVKHRERAEPGQPARPADGAPESPPSSPRPTFDEATHIPYATVTRHLWGDEDSGQVPDWVYVSSDKIHHLVFGLSPGGRFQHSQAFRTVFAADELLYVLEGSMVFSNPETGEVHPVAQGEAVFFRRDTWHHAFNIEADVLRVLEFFAPPPATGASSAYARTKDYLDESSYADERWVGRWPEGREERAEKATIHVLRDTDLLWSMEGNRALVGTYVSTEHLAVGRVVLPPGGRTATRVHTGDASLHVLGGTMNVLLVNTATANGQRWFEAHPDDGFYLPAGVRYQLHNVDRGKAEAMLAVAPPSGPL